MNIIKTLIARIEEYRATNAKPCKNYATEAAAEKAAEELCKKAKEFYGVDRDIQYVVFLVPAWGRWVAAVNTSELFQRPEFKGGYIGYFSANGFYSF